MSSWNRLKSVKEAPSLPPRQPHPYYTPRPAPALLWQLPIPLPEQSQSGTLPKSQGLLIEAQRCLRLPPGIDFSFSFALFRAMGSPGPTHTCEITWISSWPRPLIPFWKRNFHLLFHFTHIIQDCSFSLIKKPSHAAREAVAIWQWLYPGAWC